MECGSSLLAISASFSPGFLRTHTPTTITDAVSQHPELFIIRDDSSLHRDSILLTMTFVLCRCPPSLNINLTSVLNGSGRPSLAPGRPRPDPEGQVKYGSGQRGPAVGQAGGRERWRFFRPPLTWADLGPTLDPEIRKRVVNLQKITLKSFISWGRVKFCVEL